MQAFLLDRIAVIAAALHCDKHMNQLKEIVQILYTALVWLNLPVTQPVPLGDGTTAAPYKPVWPHPCVHWAAACAAHLDWCLALGTGLAAAYTERYGRKHLCAYHLDHIVAHVAAVRSQLPPTPASPAAWLASLSDKGRESCAPRLCTHDVPDGCTFAILAIDNPNCLVHNADGQVLGIASYRKFYVHKAKHMFCMKWHKTFDVPSALSGPMAAYWPDEAALVGKRKRFLDESDASSVESVESVETVKSVKSVTVS